MLRQKQIRAISWVLASLLLVIPAPIAAQSSSSPSYRVDQTYFGSGSQDTCPTQGGSQYCAQQTAGDLGVGNVCSGNNYCAIAGFNTTDDPFLEFVITADTIDLGYLDENSVKTASGTFYVRAWQSNGYVVRTASDPPTNRDNPAESINPMTMLGPSVPGTEQFGINLVDNSNPNIGADLQQVPDNTFSFGEVLAPYNDPDDFYYVKGDPVARSQRSTSVTIYTVSYIFNIDTATPSGEYVFPHSLVATGTY